MLEPTYREPLKIHFGEQANLFDSGRRQGKAVLASAKADLASLPEYNPDVSGLLSAQKQLLELSFIFALSLRKVFLAIYRALCYFDICIISCFECSEVS